MRIEQTRPHASKQSEQAIHVRGAFVALATRSKADCANDQELTRERQCRRTALPTGCTELSAALRTQITDWAGLRSPSSLRSLVRRSRRRFRRRRRPSTSKIIRGLGVIGRAGPYPRSCPASLCSM